MIYIFKLGPILTADGMHAVYTAMDEAGLVSPPIPGCDDVAGLRKAMAREVGPFFCDESLRDAAQQLGVPVVPTPGDLVEPLGQVVLGVALIGRVAAHVDNSVFSAFARAATAFYRAAPWQHWDGDDVLQATVGRDSYEVSVMGSAGQEYGLILYPKRDSVSLINGLMAENRYEEAKLTDFISMGFDEGPSYAIPFLRRAYGLDLVPEPMKVERGKLGLASEDELLTLAAVLDGVARLSRSQRFESSLILAGGKSKIAQVRAPKHASPRRR